jgi:SAM-dependent methyltransferase
MQSSDTIDLETANFLLSQTGRAAAQALHNADLSETNTLTLLTELRRRFPATQAGALLTLARLRQRAAHKFPFADQLFFTAEALEQATTWSIAEHRAAWIDRYAPPGVILDLGCGIGGDTLALAQQRSVIAFEYDPVRLQFAQANAEALVLGDQIEFRQVDWTARLANGNLPDAAAAYADPSRRAAGKRIFSLYQMQPPLPVLLQLQQQIPAVAVKVMPGVNDAELPDNCGVEFISHAGVCKEAVLWFGDLAVHQRWASVHLMTGWQSIVSAGKTPPVGPLQPGQFLHEPDPAVIRAGSFYELCERLAAFLFNAQIAYLVSPKLKLDRFVQTFLIHEIHPFSLKVLNQRLQALGIREVELKKRGFPVEPEALRCLNRLRLPSSVRAGVVIFTQQAHAQHDNAHQPDAHIMLICERVRQNWSKTNDYRSGSSGVGENLG